MNVRPLFRAMLLSTALIAPAASALA
ncbi:MAG: hypothetical protein JWP84_4525, partial [Tardiphaga sp.]|nr:hypothetical protein [Tardiphaga sp.]